eukprot:8831063-Alexandrium_andersonii.AAC.1
MDEHGGIECNSMLEKAWCGPASSPHAAGLPKAGGGLEQAEQSMQDKVEEFVQDDCDQLGKSHIHEHGELQEWSSPVPEP